MLEVRPATMEDKEAVLAFCRDTFDWGDYIEYVYDRWVDDPDGELAVAVLDDKPVGISHVGTTTPSIAMPSRATRTKCSPKNLRI